MAQKRGEAGDAIKVKACRDKIKASLARQTVMKEAAAKKRGGGVETTLQNQLGQIEYGILLCSADKRGMVGEGGGKGDLSYEIYGCSNVRQKKGAGACAATDHEFV